MQRRRVLAYVASAAGTAAVILPVRSQVQSDMPTALSPIQAAALAEVRRFYAPFHSTPDAAALRVTVEDFEWNGAVYRVDVAVDEYPIFLPWNSDYAMAHRLWLTADGQPVKSETIYTRPNHEASVAPGSLPLERRGFYPGTRAFAETLRFIERALTTAGTISFTGPDSLADHPIQLRFPRGVPDLAAHMGEVTEQQDRYLLRLSAVPLPQRTHHDVNTLTLEIDKATGTLSHAQFQINMPAALM